MAEEYTLKQQQVIAIAQARLRLEEQDKANADAQVSNEAAYNRSKQWEAAASPVDKALLIVQEALPKAWEMTKSSFATGSGAAAGQIAGKNVAPIIRVPKIVGQSVGGATGAAVGDFIAQQQAMASNPNLKYQFGQTAAAAFQGLFPVQGQKKNALMNASAETIRSLVDEKKFPELASISAAAAGGYAGAKLGKAISGVKLTPNESLYRFRNDSFRALIDEGVVVNPVELKRGNPILVMVAGGPNAIAAEAIQKNQYVWQKLAREELGLSKEALPFRPDVRNKITGAIEKGGEGELKQVIKRAAKPYEEIRAISEDAIKGLEDFNAGKTKSWKYSLNTPAEVKAILSANDNLDALKRARTEISDAAQAMKSGEEGALARFKTAKQLEDAIEEQLDIAATASGNEGLLERLIAGRKLMSQAFAVQDAVNPTLGIIDVQALESIRGTPTKAGRLLTGRLAQMADFATAFGRNAADAVNAPLAGASGSSLNYAARQTVQGKASGPISAGIPYLSEQARNMLLSPQAQQNYAIPASMLNPDTMSSSLTRNILMGLSRDTNQLSPQPLPQSKAR
jgi:hypothetical protein